MRYGSFREAMTSSQTLVFGHRGAMASAPMNTLAAFELAHQQGAHGIELDTHLSRDGRLIVLHDFSVDATTDGQGDAAELTLAQLKRLDAGAWFSDAYAGEGIPTLDEVFEAVGEKLLINVEVKSRPALRQDVCQALASCIRAHGLAKRVLVSSFDPLLLREFRDALPGIMLGYLHAPGYVDAKQLDGDFAALHPHHTMIDAAYMAGAREHGQFVNTWTVNDGRRACELMALGVNALITDDPAAMLAALAAC